MSISGSFSNRTVLGFLEEENKKSEAGQNQAAQPAVALQLDHRTSSSLSNVALPVLEALPVIQQTNIQALLPSSTDLFDPYRVSAVSSATSQFVSMERVQSTSSSILPRKSYIIPSLEVTKTQERSLSLTVSLSLSLKDYVLLYRKLADFIEANKSINFSDKKHMLTSIQKQLLECRLPVKHPVTNLEISQQELLENLNLDLTIQVSNIRIDKRFVNYVYSNEANPVMDLQMEIAKFLNPEEYSVTGPGQVSAVPQSKGLKRNRSDLEEPPSSISYGVPTSNTSSSLLHPSSLLSTHTISSVPSLSNDVSFDPLRVININLNFSEQHQQLQQQQQSLTSIHSAPVSNTSFSLPSVINDVLINISKVLDINLDLYQQLQHSHQLLTSMSPYCNDVSLIHQRAIDINLNLYNNLQQHLQIPTSMPPSSAPVSNTSSSLLHPSSLLSSHTISQVVSDPAVTLGVTEMQPSLNQQQQPQQIPLPSLSEHESKAQHENRASSSNSDTSTTVQLQESSQEDSEQEQSYDEDSDNITRFLNNEWQ